MTIVTVERRDRTHEIHIEGDRVIKWFSVTDSRRVQMQIQMRRPYKVHEDKKGKFIKLGCDEKVHKHYI